MPSRASVLRWSKERPKFAKDLAKAKAVGGRKASGYPSTYCAATAHEIFERMCEGEGVLSICRDPAMPSFSTVYYWRKQFADFRELMETARKIQAERFCDLGWEIADAVTPETAYATQVKLAQLRWTAGVMAPWAFRLKMVEPPGEQPVQSLLIRRFEIETRADGARRVVAYCPNPRTGLPERDSEGQWVLPRAADPAEPPPPRVHEPRADDAQWL
jgi:hypothetical protein